MATTETTKWDELAADLALKSALQRIDAAQKAHATRPSRVNVLELNRDLVKRYHRECSPLLWLMAGHLDGRLKHWHEVDSGTYEPESWKPQIEG